MFIPYDPPVLNLARYVRTIIRDGEKVHQSPRLVCLVFLGSKDERNQTNQLTRQIGPFGFPTEIFFCCAIHRIMDALAYL